MKSTLALLACAVFFATGADAQWQATTFQGSAFTLAHNSQVIVTSDTNSGVEIGEESSSEVGQTWHHSTKGPRAMMHIDARGEDLYGQSISAVWVGAPDYWKYSTTLWKSADSAQMWDSLVIMPNVGRYYFNDRGFHYYGGDTARYISLDGKTWTVDTTAAKSFSIPPTLHFIASYGSDSIIAISDPGAIMFSQDTGRTWSTVFDAGGKYWDWSQEEDELFGTNRNDRLILSTDRGLHWQQIDTVGILKPNGYLPDITAFTMTRGYIFVATYGDRIYRYPVVPNASVTHVNADALAAYPNPAQATLHIDGAMQNGRAIVTDALGRSVLETKMDARGEIDIHSLPSGTYTLTLSASRHLRFVK